MGQKNPLSESRGTWYIYLANILYHPGEGVSEESESIITVGIKWEQNVLTMAYH